MIGLPLRFETAEHILQYDPGKSVLLCRSSDCNRIIWAKRISDINGVSSVTEDEKKYYLSCETDEFSGRYLALIKADGVTAWSITGRAFMHVLYGGYLYIIFIDKLNRYMLIKADTDTGGKIWHREVASDMVEYSFNSQRILLKYASGLTETLSPVNGRPI